MASTISQHVLTQLDRLPIEQQRKVLDFTRGLGSKTLKGIPGSRLLRFSGVITPDDARAMSDAIQDECEKVNTDEW
jgi:hypothetical protein